MLDGGKLNKYANDGLDKIRNPQSCWVLIHESQEQIKLI